MNVTVILPTFKRPGPLVWSLLSVLHQNVGDGDARHSLVVLNNDTEREPVEKAVAKALSEATHGNWTVEVIHRDPPMDPVLSWYGGIREYARSGDVVFLHGDDDLMLPGSLAARSAILEESGAPILLTLSRSGLVFEEGDAARAFFPAPIGSTESARDWRFVAPHEMTRFGPAFIGNHAYRASQEFFAGFDEVLSLMRSVPLEGRQQLAMLPYFLPLPFLSAKRVAGAEIAGTLRGMRLEEAVGHRFGHFNWVPGLLYAASLLLLESPPLRDRAELAGMREEMLRNVHRWYVPSMVDRETRLQFRHFQRALGVPRLRHASDLAAGAWMTAKTLAGGQALLHRMFGWGEPASLDDLIASYSRYVED